MSADDRSGNGKTFADMLGEAAGAGTPISDPDVPPTAEAAGRLSDAMLAALELEPLSDWQKLCVAQVAFLRLVTGGGTAKRQASMIRQQMEMLMEKCAVMLAICASGERLADMSMSGCGGPRAKRPNVEGHGHA